MTCLNCLTDIIMTSVSIRLLYISKEVALFVCGKPTNFELKMQLLSEFYN